MTTAAQPVFQTWRELYTAALFEANEDRIPSRIKEAEKAIVARARELFAADADTIEEDQALDDALYALRALQSCLSFARLPNSTRHSRREVFHSVPEGTLLRFVPGPANNDPVANSQQLLSGKCFELKAVLRCCRNTGRDRGQSDT